METRTTQRPSRCRDALLANRETQLQGADPAACRKIKVPNRVNLVQAGNLVPAEIIGEGVFENLSMLLWHL
jgi:hypothetical protein